VAGVHPVAAAGFGAAAELYERARPSYPAEAVEWVVERCGLGAGKTIVDIGAGTGKLTRLLVPCGARVIAVEPVAEMRARLVATTPDAEVLEGTAERLPLAEGSADVVTVAQALHWFDLDRALQEVHRILRPDGRLVLFWNMRDLDDPIQRGVEELLAPRRDYVIGQQEGRWRAPLAESPLFGDSEVAEFRYEQRFTADDLCDRVASTSFVAAMAPVEREALLVEIRALTYGVPEPFPFPYVTEVHLIPRMSDPADFGRGTSIEG
jgi:SAM-dependent methyltransferase